VKTTKEKLKTGLDFLKKSTNVRLDLPLAGIWKKITPILFHYPYELPKSFFLKPPVYRLNDESLNWLKEANRYHYRLKKINRTLEIYEFGQGPTILMIHGWGGRGLQLAPFIGPLLEKGFKVVTFDLPGHGNSTGKGCTYYEFVEALRTVSGLYPNAKGIIAHSMGGGAATVLASEHPDPKFKTILIAPHYDLREEFYSWAKSAGASPHLIASFIHLSEIRFHYSFEDINPKNVTSKIRGPFLLIHDTQDKAAKFSSSELLHQSIPHSQFIKTEGKGHNKILQDTEIINSVVKFLEGQV